MSVRRDLQQATADWIRFEQKPLFARIEVNDSEAPATASVRALQREQTAAAGIERRPAEGPAIGRIVERQLTPKTARQLLGRLQTDCFWMTNPEERTFVQVSSAIADRRALAASSSRVDVCFGGQGRLEVVSAIGRPEASMIIALLFNWRAYPETGNYWHAIRGAVFSTGIIQRSGRHMKLSIGDVLVGLERGQDPEALFMAAFGHSEWGCVHEERLIDGFPTVFGMVFENMPTALAKDLSEALFQHAGYMGAISVHFEFSPHLALYRLRLPPHYRLEGVKLRSFYSMGNEDGCDPSDLEDMQRLGYADTAFEDMGAGRTILDDFDTPRHFERVAAFRKLLTQWLPGGEDDAYQLTMMLEDLSPRLFNALGAAAERLASAENEEEVAQVAISGRRYMEQLANALFPPTNTPRGKRKLDKLAYRNRLWAFAEDHLQGDPTRLSAIGKEVDRVVEELNGGLHADRPKERVARSISDAAILTATLFALNPDAIRNGYLAYMDSLRAFVGELAAQSQP